MNTSLEGFFSKPTYSVFILILQKAEQRKSDSASIDEDMCNHNDFQEYALSIAAT
jgi:hypothetical protein